MALPAAFGRLPVMGLLLGATYGAAGPSPSNSTLTCSQSALASFMQGLVASPPSWRGTALKPWEATSTCVTTPTLSQKRSSSAHAPRPARGSRRRRRDTSPVAPSAGCRAVLGGAW